MTAATIALSRPAVEAAAARRHIAAHLQRIESNPLTSAELALFETFEREAWTHARRLSHILALVGGLAGDPRLDGAACERDPYTIASTNVLRNRLGILDAGQLDRAERLLAVQRAAEGLPAGDFDLAHLRAIHRHLLQDVFDWAGEIRTVEISKGGHQFQFRQFIEVGLADVHRRLVRQRHLAGLTSAAFATAAAHIIGDVNFVHPFREGNGRTQLHYLAQLAQRAGHALDLTRLSPAGWIAASRAANDGDYAPMALEIARAFA